MRLKWINTLFAVAVLGLGFNEARAAEDKSRYPALFHRAAAEFDVPADVLMGLAFAETRWAHLTWPAGETASPCNGMPRPLGIMSLWDNQWFGHSLREGAALIGQPIETVKADVFQNIRAGAAVLRKLYNEQPLPEGTDRREIESWRNAIIAYCGIPQPDLAAQHALDVFAHMNRGYHKYGIEWPGRRVNLEPARDAVRRVKDAEKGRRGKGERERALAQGADPLFPLSPLPLFNNEPPPPEQQRFLPAAQPDYPGALWRQAYPGHWYTTGVGRYFVVIHDMEGYYLSTISYFQRETTQASAHYCVNGKTDYVGDAPPGEITQMVEERFWAWHVSCWNRYMLGIEHEGFANNPAWYTEEQYQASADLTRYLCDKYSIPKDRNHIIAHGEHLNATWRSWMAANWPQIDTSCNTHYDPGQHWDWPHYMALVIGDVNNAAVATVSAPDSVAPGASFTATVTMQNTGTKVWTSDATPHRLGSQSAQDNTRWGLSRVNLPSTPINPGASAAFTFTCTAPTNLGSYAFDWRMVEEATEWFGATATKTISVAIQPPNILIQPTNVIRNPGESATFIVAAGGTGPRTYQWRKNGVNLVNGGNVSGATTAVFTLNNVQLADAGFYSAAISNPGGTTVSQDGQLLFVTTQPTPPGSGAGLRALVFDNADFTSMKRARIDATVNFDWADGAPSSTTDADSFSIRWLGQVEPRYSQTYTFHTRSDDGVRLWVNGVLLIDKWQDQSLAEWTGSIALEAGRRYDMRMDYFENSGAASAQLWWSSASQVKEIIPGTQLYRPPPAVATLTNRFVSAGTLVSFTVFATNADPWLSSQPLTDFNDYADGQDDVMFRNPSYSGSTDQFLDSAETNYAAVITALPAGNASVAALKARWAFTNGAVNPWLRLTTANMPILPNPAIDLTQSLWFDVQADRNVKIALGVRESGTTSALGGDGTQNGPIEFVGVTGAPGGVPVPTRTVAAGAWTTLRFDLSRELAALFAGTGANGVLSSTNNRGALEHIAIVPLAGAGLYRVHLDNFLSVVNNRLTFALEPGAPAGASLNPTNGQFTWAVPAAQPPGTYPITVRVPDTGSPAWTVTQTFYVVVGGLPPLRIVRGPDAAVTLSWDSLPGQRYRLQHKPSLVGASWQSLAETIANGTTASHIDSPVASQRFYRLIVE